MHGFIHVHACTRVHTHKLHSITFFNLIKPQFFRDKHVIIIIRCVCVRPRVHECVFDVCRCRSYWVCSTASTLARPRPFPWQHILPPSHHLWSQKWKDLCDGRRKKKGERKTERRGRDNRQIMLGERERKRKKEFGNERIYLMRRVKERGMKWMNLMR